MQTNLTLKSQYWLCLTVYALLGWGCQPTPSQLFRARPSSETGITFANRLTETDSLNALTYEYMYNGAGIGAGDFNNDGLTDLYFAGNQVSSRLYLNRGQFRFDDITEKSGTGTDVWCTGVSVADVNQDGWMDIYVCVAGPAKDTTRRANKLFINNGSTSDHRPTFTERAADYGLADMGYSTQAAFFDYDRDGDLDCYVLTNALESINRNTLRPKRLNGEAPSTDRLYRNEGSARFKNVSREEGILAEGYGLGLCISDLNNDGWPDIYCADDFLSNDLIWMNQKGQHQGGPAFVNRAGAMLKHQTHNGMGVDVADINNDARPDIMVLDMLPEGNQRQKMMLPGSNYNRFQMDLQQGYEPQYMRNTLQLNRGCNPAGEVCFSEIGQLAGVSKTDWSWAPLLADLDNDGHKDLYITNGYRRDVTNLDFIVFNHEQASFGTAEAQMKQARAELNRLPQISLPNYAYRNRNGEPEGGLQMEDVSARWGLNQPGYSNGAVYADLDNDGDLDLVTNNIDDEAFVLENRLNQREIPPHWLRLAIAPVPGLPVVQGTKVWLYAAGQVQMQELSPVRGYVSTVEQGLHFGLGGATRFDSLMIRYPNGQRQRLAGGPANQRLTVAYQPAGLWQPAPEPTPLFTQELPAQTGLKVVHQVSGFVDFNRTPLLPHQYSRNGPGLATGDADGNGLADVFVGGGAGKPAQLCLQQPNGRFTMAILPDTSPADDMGALFFDADGDGDQDLYVVSGGSQSEGASATYQDRLYVNAGRGRLTLPPGRLPAIRSSGSCVVAADIDHDGDLDLFRGGRVVPGQYPKPADSYLLRNDGGTFHDLTDQLAPGLRQVGMVTAALWTDTNNDGQTDLLLVGEWMPPTIFAAKGGKFVYSTIPSFAQCTGWWNTVAGADFDGDGDQDYVLGNLGLNAKFRASVAEPVRVFADDFDHNGTYDPVLTFFLNHQHVPVPQRDVLMAQIPSIKKRFPTYQDYASRLFENTFTEEEQANALKREATQLASCYVENMGNNQFIVKPLPIEAQFSPVFGIVISDFTGDGQTDLLLAGNSYASETIGGWYDAGKGLLLAGNGKGHFRTVQHAGLAFDQDAKAMTTLHRPDGTTWILVANNNGPLQVMQPRFCPPVRPLSGRTAIGSGTRPGDNHILFGKRE